MLVEIIYCLAKWHFHVRETPVSCTNSRPAHTYMLYCHASAYISHQEGRFMQQIINHNLLFILCQLALFYTFYHQHWWIYHIWQKQTNKNRHHLTSPRCEQSQTSHISLSVCLRVACEVVSSRFKENPSQSPSYQLLWLQPLTLTEASFMIVRYLECTFKWAEKCVHLFFLFYIILYLCGISAAPFPSQKRHPLWTNTFTIWFRDALF